jgi:hypothetical protein
MKSPKTKKKSKEPMTAAEAKEELKKDPIVPLWVPPPPGLGEQVKLNLSTKTILIKFLKNQFILSFYKPWSTNPWKKKTSTV